MDKIRNVWSEDVAFSRTLCGFEAPRERTHRRPRVVLSAEPFVGLKHGNVLRRNNRRAFSRTLCGFEAQMRHDYRLPAGCFQPNPLWV